MKKTALFFAIVLTVGLMTTATAQLSIGPRVAVNFSNIAFSDADEDVDTKNLFGVAFGAAAEIGINDMFAIQPELLYSQHGFSLEDSLLGETIKLDFRPNYLQIPLLVKLKFGSEPLMVNVLAGPHVGFGIGDITATTTFLGEEDKDTSSWEDAGFSKFDFGITGGVGVSFAAGPGNLGLDIRYQLGLSNIGEDTDDDEKASNRNFQVGLSYLIPIGGR